MKDSQKNKIINISNKSEIKEENKDIEKIQEKKHDENNYKDFSENNGILYKKITKPIELENFETSSHLKKNIEFFDINCKDKICQQSYYCITCKQSVCIKCGVYEHKDHILIQRDNCLFYDPKFFVEISKIIDLSLTLDTKKQTIKNSIENSIIYLKNHLDQLKIVKFKEIDEYFEKNNQNLNDLKNNFLISKNSIENYYKTYKKFFNINYNNEKNKKEDEINNNLDIENTVFIMNFDLMNLCDSKNLQVLDKINELTQKINSLNSFIDKRTKDLINIINNKFNLEFNYEKYEDFYYDIKVRTKKYSDIIQQFQETIADIIQKTGSIDKIKELLDIFDSKNKKNKNIIFQQNYFHSENNNIKSESNDNNRGKKILTSRSNNYLLNTTKNESKDKNLKVNLCANIKKNKSKNNLNFSSSRSSKKMKTIFSPNKNYNKFHHTFFNFLSENPSGSGINNTLLTNRTISPNKFNSEDVILDNRILQRFFAYSIYDFYKQNILKGDSNKKHDNQIQNKKTNSNTSKSGSSNKESPHLKNIYTPKNSLHKKKLFSNNNEEEMDTTQYNVKSVSYLANYQNRYNSLKERIKPIIGTNQIQIFEPSTKKIIKKITSLNKEEHGYSIFPDGCRHIFIDNILYITGGNNNCGYIVLSYDVLSNKLTRLSNFVGEHSFHSLEYVDNFDCIICVGGENCSICEIMDINSKIWKKLPNLNYPRANTNIYYNNITEEIYALFGMNGNMWKNCKNSDKIEVLNLNNIDLGWLNVDYYKGGGLDLKFNYCKTMPFTKNKLVIFGGNNMRSIEAQGFYALFDMNKNEIFKVDKQTMELIKLEEKKMRIADLALTKIN